MDTKLFYHHNCFRKLEEENENLFSTEQVLNVKELKRLPEQERPSNEPMREERFPLVTTEMRGAPWPASSLKTISHDHSLLLCHPLN